MQVDPKPSPWPCVLMLLAMLLFCLTVPRFWRSGDMTITGDVGDSMPLAMDAPTTSALGSNGPMLGSYTSLNPLGTDGFHEIELVLPAGILPQGSLLSLCPPPTIEELIENARLGLARNDLNIGFPGIDIVTGQTFESSAAPVPGTEWSVSAIGPSQRTTPVRSALVTAIAEQAGRVLLKYSLADMVRPLTSGLARLHELCAPPERDELQIPTDVWPVAPDNPPVDTRIPIASAPRLESPDDRLAMVPPAAETTPPPAANDASPLEAPPEDKADEGDTGPWCVPQVLFEQIERLAQHPVSATWAHSAMAQLRAITQRERWETGDVSSLLLGLSQSAEQAKKLASGTDDDRLRVELLRAHWGLARRLDCWAAVHEIRVAQQSQDRVATRGSLKSLLVEAPTSGQADATELSVDLEAYERSRDPQIGRLVTARQQELEASASPLDRSLAEAVEQHYRNANVRIAITSDLLNRLLREQHSEKRLVRDRIAGTPVRGRSHTVSESSIQLQPAEGRWQLGVEAQGVVDSRTTANGGGARLHSSSSTDFAAQKTVVVDPSGVRFEPTVVNATNHNRLIGVTTDFDWVPLLRSFARNRAVQEYRARRSRARAEVESRVVAQAIEQMDEKTLAAIDRIEQDVQSRLLDPMAEFGVELTPIELTTTEERLVARLRIAGNNQLGGHTPRPQALSDSLASLQVHESALVNAAAGLGLDGMRYTAPELHAHLRAKFPRLAEQNSPEARRDTVFEFAYRDAVQLRIDDGRLELLLGLSCVELQGRRMENVIVHAYYVPAVEVLDAELVRDGPLGIEGRISSTDRARLHNVFNTVLSQERRLPLVRLEKFGDSRLNGLAITQMVLDDGWIGVAIGPNAPQRTAERSRSLP